MPAQRFTSSGPSGRLGAAMLPVPAAMASGYQSWGPVVGMPSRSRIPAPASMPGTDRESVAKAINGIIGIGSSAVEFWNPALYYQPRPPAASGNLDSGPGMAVNSDNQMPVPAGNPNGAYAMLMRRPRWTGQKQVGWPITTPKFQWKA
jgi:hypothetical protein